jgi:glycine cleavage system transcriptional repressor
MNSYILTFVSTDKIGIVAQVTKVLFEKGFNILDSSSTRLGSVFSMILFVEHKNLFEIEEIKKWFKELTVSVFIADPQNADDDCDSYLVSVYGSDKPGIVYNVAKVLSDEGINIIQLETAKGEVYVIVLEVCVKKNADDCWKDKLKIKAKEIGTDISVRKLEVFEL